jgi:mitogen-activated protein kinase kinase kinase
MYTGKADVWSIGCVVIEMLSGHRPWAGLSEISAMYLIGTSGRPDIPERISADAQQFCIYCLEM